MRKSKIELQPGNVFGELTVIREEGKEPRGHYVWLCLCECGKTKIVRGASLQAGSVRSCGCLQGQPGLQINCDYCGKQITKQYSKTVKQAHHFCNRKCMGKWQTKNNNPDWKDGEAVIRKCGYAYIPVKNGSQKEHVVIAEWTLGRKLKHRELVHHINMNKTDNRNENLLICTMNYHSSLHARMAEEYARRFL